MWRIPPLSLPVCVGCSLRFGYAFVLRATQLIFSRQMARVYNKAEACGYSLCALPLYYKPFSRLEKIPTVFYFSIESIKLTFRTVKQLIYILTLLCCLTGTSNVLVNDSVAFEKEVHFASDTGTGLVYQGQYYDTEIELAYNRFRYYDPEDGRYISQDPIRLAGEMPNMYAYVHDSNSWVDVFGLDTFYQLFNNSGDLVYEGITERNIPAPQSLLTSRYSMSKQKR